MYVIFIWIDSGFAAFTTDVGVVEGHSMTGSPGERPLDVVLVWMYVGNLQPQPSASSTEKDKFESRMNRRAGRQRHPTVVPFQIVPE